MSGAGDDGAFDDDETCIEEDVHNQLGDPLTVAQMQLDYDRWMDEEAVKLDQFKQAVKNDVELARLQDELQKCVSQLPAVSVETVEDAFKSYKNRRQTIKNSIYK